MGTKEFLLANEEKRQKCEIWTRVMGYMRNLASFNVGKKSEFKERVFYKVKSK